MSSLTRSMGAAAVFETAAETPPTVDEALVTASTQREFRCFWIVPLCCQWHGGSVMAAIRGATYSRSRPRSPIRQREEVSKRCDHNAGSLTKLLHQPTGTINNSPISSGARSRDARWSFCKLIEAWAVTVRGRGGAGCKRTGGRQLQLTGMPMKDFLLCSTSPSFAIVRE